MSLRLLANVQVFVGIISIIVGLLLVFATGSALFSGFEASVASAIIGTEFLTSEEKRLMHWLLATCGAGIIGWGVAWTFIAHIPLRRGEVWAWWCFFISLCSWVIVDLSVALWFGVLAETAFVSIAFIAAVSPLNRICLSF